MLATWRNLCLQQQHKWPLQIHNTMYIFQIYAFLVSYISSEQLILRLQFVTSG